MNWFKKIKAVFLAIVLIAPVVCVTIAAINDVANISTLIVTTTEEEHEDKDGEEEVENDNVKPFLPQSTTSVRFIKHLGANFYTKGFKLQNRSGDVFSPPPELT